MHTDLCRFHIYSICLSIQLGNVYRLYILGDEDFFLTLKELPLLQP